ncbi:hypothetical protein GPALN_012559 [Globodera pallida]|nr:hypothetical protein GPALN_012559 [Globodera pallida]
MTSKTTSKRASGATVGSKSNKQPEPPLSTSSAVNFFKIEDAASKELSTDKTIKESAAQIAAIRSLLTSSSGNVRRQELKDPLILRAVKLRRLNRYFNFRNNFARDRLAEVRRKVEENYLSLQNLTNETTHLRKNIDVCMEFQAGDSDIGLVGLEEFNASAVAEVNGTGEVSEVDPHQLHLARLKHELGERRSMLANLQELEGRKSALLSDIRGKEQRLSQVRSKIQAIKKATSPLFDVLGLKARPFEIGHKAKAVALGTLSVQLRPLNTNEEFCREIFGTHSIELGCDGLVQIREEVVVEPMDAGGSNGTTEGNGLAADGKGEGKTEALATARAKDFFAAEDALAEGISAEQSQTKALECIGTIRTILGGHGQMLQQQQQSSELLPNAIALRRLNRRSNFRITAARAKVAQMRTRIEERTVELRNALVGVDFLKKCVGRCLDFQSHSHSDIDLIPTEQFFAEVPTFIPRPAEFTRNDAHHLQMALLKHELWTRKNLVDEVKEMEQKRKASLEAIAEAEGALGRLQPRVDTLKRTAKPLLDIVGLKSVVLSVHNRAIPFRPVPVGAETFREIFGDPKGGAVTAVGEGSSGNDGVEDGEEEEPMELGDDDDLLL